jgi:hypothetical protein
LNFQAIDLPFAVPKAMQIYVFKGSDGWYGFTDEPSIRNLPPDKGPWVPDETSQRAMFKDERHQAPREPAVLPLEYSGGY